MSPPPLHARRGSHEHSQQLIAALADMARAGEPLPSLIYVNVTYPLALTFMVSRKGRLHHLSVRKRDEEDHHASEAASFD